MILSLAAREGIEEERRKDRVSASNKIVEDKLRKDLHYDRLVSENIRLKAVLIAARNDINDWVYSKGESPQSTKVLKEIEGLL